jgi:excisionase family DNA binding protein
MSELLTIPEVADRLRVSRRTVERLIATGRLRAIAVGRRRLVTDRELEMYIARSRR